MYEKWDRDLKMIAIMGLMGTVKRDMEACVGRGSWVVWLPQSFFFFFVFKLGCTLGGSKPVPRSMLDNRRLITLAINKSLIN